MRFDLGLLQSLHKSPGVVAHVGRQCQLSLELDPLRQVARCLPLGMAADSRGATIHDQPVAVVHQGVAQVSQARLLSRLAGQPGIRVGSRRMRLIGTPLATEVFAPVGC
jgi:hypothetical protein